MKYVIALFLALFFNAMGNILAKIGMTRPPEVVEGVGVSALRTTIDRATSGPSLLGLAFFCTNAACYYYALQSTSLKINIAYPIMVGGGYALIALMAHFHPALKERLTVGQWIGVSLVMVGLILIAIQTRQPQPPPLIAR